MVNCIYFWILVLIVVFRYPSCLKTHKYSVSFWLSSVGVMCFKSNTVTYSTAEMEGWPHTRRYKPDTEPSFPTAAFGEGHSPIFGLVIINFCPVTPQVCGVKNIRASLISNHKYQAHGSASSGRPTIAKRKEETKTCQQSNVAYFNSAYLLQCIECLLSQDFTHIPVPPACRHCQTQCKLGQAGTASWQCWLSFTFVFFVCFFLLKSCLITQVSVMSQSYCCKYNIASCLAGNFINHQTRSWSYK